MLTPKKPRMFKRYKNLSGKSKVTAYEIAKDGMIVKFADNSAYRWTNQSADPENISKMKVLAQAGKGLETYINANVKDRFLKKVR